MYIKQFPKDLSEADLLVRFGEFNPSDQKMFEQFGPILSLWVPKDDEGKSKGFAFVCFEKFDHALEA